ncbi:MAG: single-stranded DNA-binding protein [Clostridia bacterium]
MNKVILIGNLTRDPEVRTTGSGTNVCSFSIAVNRKFSNQAGEKVTDFFNIVAWRQLGELCGKYLAKGRKVCVVGEVQNRSYEAKDGTKRTVTEIIADDIEFLTPRQESGGGGNYSTPAEPFAPQSNAADGFVDVQDDDLPF